MNPRQVKFQRKKRKAAGVYYTPPVLVELLLDQVWPDVVKDAGADLGKLRICDPACGIGDFLVAVQRRLVRDLAQGREPREEDWGLARRCLLGVDLDRRAAKICAWRLFGGLRALPIADCRLPIEEESRGAGYTPGAVVCGDALLGNVGLVPGTFDLVIGNPPFVNTIEGDVNASTKARLRKRYERVRGAADLAFYFLELATRLVRPGGRIALVMPRGVLNAPAVSGLRKALPDSLRPNLIWAPERCNFFRGAAVFTCLLVLGPDLQCRVSVEGNPAQIQWKTGTIGSDNWWQGMQQILSGSLASAADSGAMPTGTPRLGDVFELKASLTASDAYNVLGHLRDERDATGQKFVTTGLIDRAICRWGDRRCRYLKRDFACPRVVESDGLTASLKRRLADSRRPKILVAGLSRQLEAFLDERGEYLGAVSTYSIFHPGDDVEELRRLLQFLLSEDVSKSLVSELGGNGLRGRHVTVKKSFLLSLRITS